MLGTRLRGPMLVAFAASCATFLPSMALADIPVGPRPSALAPVETIAPLKVTIVREAGAQATLVLPRKFAEHAGAVAGEGAAPPANSNGLAAIATVAGGGALSLGVLLLGIYLIRRTSRRAQTAVAGTVAAVVLFVGVSFVFADLIPGRPLGPIPDREDRVVRPKPDQPQVKIVIVDEGDAIELTLPQSLVNAKR